MKQTLRLENELLKKEVERLRRISQYDSLCNVYNKGTIEAKIDACLQRNKQGVLLVIDLNRFKFINDNFGHLVGDRLLVAIAYCLKQNAGNHGMVGRIGGDEFVVYFEGKISNDEIIEKINRIKKEVRDIEILKQGSPKITLAIYCDFVQEEDDYKRLFDRVDQKLSVYKRTRRSPHLKPKTAVMKTEIKCYDYDAFCQMRGSYHKQNYRLLMIKILRVDKSEIVASDDEGIQSLFLCIQNSLREGDIFTRYSSNQFLVLCQFIQNDKVCLVKQRIRKMFQELGKEEYCIRITNAKVSE